MLDLQPYLVGTHVEIRPLRANDWAGFYGIASDPLIWAVHPHHTRWQVPVCRQFFAEGLASGGAVMIVDAKSAAPIGASRYRLVGDGRSVEIGWTFLARSHWGGATNREVKRLMLAHAFTHVERVEFRVGAANARSRRAMEKIGGVLTDRTEWPLVNDVPVEHVTYEITRHGFATGPLNPPLSRSA